MGLKLVTMMVIVSDSMRPNFERGDIIITQSLSLSSLKEGDIVTFNVLNKQYGVTHRIEKIEESGRILTKGDANPWTDEYYTTQKDVLYKAIIIDDKPIVIKGVGALFITDYSRTGVIYKWGDRFTFLQQLSVTIKAWGYVITIIALLLFIISMKR
jgi:signal peptidase I